MKIRDPRAAELLASALPFSPSELSTCRANLLKDQYRWKGYSLKALRAQYKEMCRRFIATLDDLKGGAA